MSDDIDYAIVFPLKNMNDMEKPPVVFLFGWAGCQDRYLAKYSDLYKNIGCINIRYSSPVDVSFWHTERTAYAAAKLYDVLYEMAFEDHPIFFHMFSGGGCFIFNAFMRHMERQTDHTLRVCGLMFDSAPAVRNNYVRALAYTTVHYPMYTGWLQTIVAGVMYATFSLFDIYQTVYDRLLAPFLGHLGPYPHVWTPRESTDFMMVDTIPHCPQLYLYSRADAICDYKQIERYAATQKARGVPVEQVCWQDTPHCKHMPAHAQDYTRAISQFLEAIV